MEHQSLSSPPQAVPESFLLQKPRLWTSEHLRLLNVVHLRDVPAVDIVGDAYLPTEGDEELDYVLSDLMKPSKEDIAERDYVMYRNHFTALFQSLRSVMEPPSCRPENMTMFTRWAASDMFCGLCYAIEAGGDLDPHVRYFKFKYRYGNFRCDGALIWKSRGSGWKPPPIPLMTISIAKDEKHASIANHEVPHMLAQAVMAFDKYPNLNSYRTFVLRLRRTVWQLSTATITRSYVEAVQKQMPLPTSLDVYSSQEFDMVERGERKEMTVILVGALRCMVDREEAG